MNEAELLFTQVLSCERQDLYLNKGLSLTKDAFLQVSSALKRRVFGEPIQYILGETEFMGLRLKLTPDVFIPRPETEILVEAALKILGRSADRPVSGFKILDLGTGSGCIAISLAKFLPQAQVCATDISKAAIEVAKANALLNNVKINFLESDLFSIYNLQPTTYDLIVSNPPYIPSGEIGDLARELQYEPRIALDGGENGLGFYYRIIPEAADYLKAGGFLAMEIGLNQKGKIENIIQNTAKFEIIGIIKDYNNIDRVIIARKLFCHG